MSAVGPNLVFFVNFSHLWFVNDINLFIHTQTEGFTGWVKGPLSTIVYCTLFEDPLDLILQMCELRQVLVEYF